MSVGPARRFARIVALTLVLAPTLSAQGVTASELSERLDAYRTTNRIPGAVLAVAFTDGRVISVASGQSDTARKLAMRPDDRLLMGSVGKTYVSAVALQLVRERRLELDALASRYVGGQGWFDSLPNAAAITVRHLMNHSSGLVRYEFKPEFTAALSGEPDKVWDPREQVRYLHGTTAAFAPGAGWDYSDTNYLVLALILESITRRPIDTEIAARFLGPERLTNTVPSDARTIPGLAQGYAGAQNPFGGRDAMLTDGRMIINPQFEGAGGGYAATAADAARWGALYFSGRLFGDSLLEQAITGPVARLGPGTRYGLGMILRDSTAAGAMRGHSGFFPGYLTELRHYPARGITLALLINTSSLRVAPPMARWLDELAATIDAPPALPPSRGALTPGTLAITNVAVIPMTRDTVLRDHTVVVRDGRIVALGPSARTTVPAGAMRIDGRGRWLIPGLSDTHTHLYADGEYPDSIAPAELGVMLANGITTARLMIGTPQHLALRRQILEGAVIGPQLWVASPQLAGRPYENGIAVTTPEEARAAVRRVHRDGYDQVKLTMFVTPATFDAIVDEARTLGIRVVGHIEPAVGVASALRAGQQVEHLDSYFEAALADSAPSRESVTQMGLFRLERWRSLDHLDDRKLDSLAGATTRAGVYSGPTLNVFNDAFAGHPSDEEIRARPEWSMFPEAWRAGYLRARTNYWSERNATVRTPERLARFIEARNRLVKGIVDSGGKLLAGSDSPEWFHLYGFGLHRELEAYVRAGLTPFQALSAATRWPAEFFGASNEWGTIAVGRRADLVLLRGDPRADVRQTTAIDGVLVGGRWMPRARLDAMVEEARRSLRPEG